MSIEAHPNINAAGFVTGVIMEYLKYLRGPAKAAGDPAALRAVRQRVEEFVTQVSCDLDDKFGTENDGA